MFRQFLAVARRLVRYRQTLTVLKALDDRLLADLGLERSGLRSTAWQVAASGAPVPLRLARSAPVDVRAACAPAEPARSRCDARGYRAAP